MKFCIGIGNIYQQMIIREKKMLNEAQLEKYYDGLGYKNLGLANFHPQITQEAAQKSTNKIIHNLGRNLQMVVCCDLKVYFTVDSSD